MSVLEEDVELRDLLAQTLEKNGCLAKLRAELRASIFLALDEDIKLNKQQKLQNLRVQSYLETPDGRTMFCLVREFLEFFNLHFTISVYEPESYLDSIGQYEGRQKVAKDLGLDNTGESTVPLLQQLLKIAQTKSKHLDINLNLNENTNGSYKDDSFNIDSSYKKTDSFNSTSKSSNNDLQLIQEKNDNFYQSENRKLDATFNVSPKVVDNSQTSDKSIDSKIPINSVSNQEELNKTNNSSNNLSIEKNESFNNLPYEMSTVNANKINQSQNIIDISVPLPKHLKDIKEDDTYEDTSSIAEDSEVLEKPVDASISEDIENNVPLSPKISHITKIEVDKPKLSPQWPKTSLSSLSDLPPLSSNKTRVSSDILPSLYSKEFKNKSNLKELDKMFDMEADYEEDFMYSNELSLNAPSVNLSQSKNVTLEESFIANKNNLDMLNIINKKDVKGSPKAISDVEKSLLKPIQTNCSNLVKTSDHSNNSSISSESVNSAQ